jgi:hypothetical protein
MNGELSDGIIHHLTTEREGLKQHSQMYTPSKPPFYSFPLLRPANARPLPPVKINSNYANIKSRVNSNFKKPQIVQKQSDRKPTVNPVYGVKLDPILE